VGIPRGREESLPKNTPRRKKKDRRDDGGGYPSRRPPSTLLNVKATVFLEVFCFSFKNFIEIEKKFEFKSFNSKLEIVFVNKKLLLNVLKETKMKSLETKLKLFF